MHHGPLHRTERRSAPGGTSALLIAPQPGPAPTGQHRVPRGVSRGGARRRPPAVPQRRAPREPQATMQLLMSGLAAVIMTGICGLSAFFVIADERHARSATRAAAATPPAVVRDITSRATDPQPLTSDEVFGQPEIAMVPGASPYRLLLRHIDGDCRVAATGDLDDLLQEHGCSQVVRATLIAPVAGYPVTAGVFNLADEDAARSVSRRLKALVEGGDGRVAGMAVDDATRPLESPVTQVSWHTRGHFLVYCVIARPDGRIIADDDPYAQRIVFDLVETHLRRDVLDRRAVLPA